MSYRWISLEDRNSLKEQVKHGNFVSIATASMALPYLPLVSRTDIKIAEHSFQTHFVI